MSGCWLFKARYCCIIGVCPPWAVGGDSRFIAAIVCGACSLSCASLVQLHLRIGLVADHARERIEGHPPEPVQRPDVQAIERDVEELREEAFDAERPTGDEPHERTDGLVVAE